MCDSLAHGGPDDEGFYVSEPDGLVLGHRRLAIIDLSANGHQPMADVDRRAWTTFNGEIYNYPELKAELVTLGAKFLSDTDTEVIIQAYLCWGTASFAKLRGIFAFALYDKEQGITYLVRDSFGIKPLYYHISDYGISFASEVKALREAGLAIEQDKNWAIRFLAYGHMPVPYTTLKNVYSLPKGHFLSWQHQSNSHQITPYYLYNNVDKEIITDVNEARTCVRNALDKTVERQLLADAAIGVFLSGGIDSSLITLLAHQHKKDQLKTVSIFFNDQAYNEQRYQNIILNQTAVQNYQHLVTQKDFENALPGIINSMDMPTTDGINSWFICKYAHESGLKSVLSGLGGDELFGGYPSFRRIKYLRYLKAIPAPLLTAIARLSAGKFKRLALLTHKHPLAEYFFLRGLFVPAEIAKILNIKESYVINTLFAEPLQLKHLSHKEKAAWFETNIYMQNQLLRDTDVMSMAHGLEVRVPFLDEDFVKAVDSIDSAIRFDDTPPKKLLIDSYQGLLPKEVWDRKKMGFSFPLQNWMRQHPQIGDTGYYENPYARRVIDNFNKNKVHWSKAYALYQLQHGRKVTDINLEKKILLLTLQTFSGTGGIQKMSRIMAKVLQQIAIKKNWKVNLYSGYDDSKHLDTKYIDASNFKGFNKNRALFAVNATARGLQADVIILTHINLSVIGLFTKILKPKCQVWLVAHGIEVWRPLGFFKRKLLQNCTKIICVSNFTKHKLIELHGVDPVKCVVLNNALDPVKVLPVDFIKPLHLMTRYHLSPQNKILFTLTRLASTEQYKGYEQVIKAVSILKQQYPELRYILSGKYDSTEELRINQLIEEFDVGKQVVVTGFIEEEELADYFLLADLFVLPSKKEGFGLVFIEALSYGLPVICGNEDGSLDAIRCGELGTAVDPDNVAELVEAISKQLNKPQLITDRKILQQKCLQYFNTENYKHDLETMLTE